VLISLLLLLDLEFCTSQLGLIGGPVSLVCFAIITYISALLLFDCYRSPNSITGTQNYSYMDAVRVNLGSITPTSFLLLEVLPCREEIKFCVYKQNKKQSIENSTRKGPLFEVQKTEHDTST
jgi:hypothetical protein